MSDTTQQSLAMIRELVSNSRGQRIQNADETISSISLPGIDLRGVAQLSVLNTPFTNRFLGRAAGLKAPVITGRIVQGTTGRASGYFGTAEEGKRGGTISISGALSGARHRTLSVEWGETDEAFLTTQDDYDTVGQLTAWALAETRRRHHILNLFGRTTGPTDSINGDAYASGGIGSTPTPTVSNTTTGGTIVAQVNSVIAVALNGEGWYKTRTYVPNVANTWIAQNGVTVFGSELLDYTRTNADGTTTVQKGGTAIKSSAQTSTTTTGASTLTLSLPPLQGALGYAWFVGLAGSEVYQGTTAIATVTLTNLVTGASYQPAASVFTADNTPDPFVYDGLITRLQGSTAYGPTGALITTLTNGNTLTAAPNGGIVEFNAVLKALYTNLDGYSPEYVLVSGNTYNAVNTALFGSPSTSKSTYFIPFEGGDAAGVTAGNAFTFIKNPITKEKIEIVVDPYVPDGIALFGSRVIPNAVGGSTASEAATFYTLRDYWGEMWPRVTRSYRGAVHLHGSLFLRAPAIFGIINNIAT